MKTKFVLYLKIIKISNTQAIFDIILKNSISKNHIFVFYSCDNEIRIVYLLKKKLITTNKNLFTD